VGERENVDGEQQVEDGIEGTGGGKEPDETLHEGSEQVELEIVAAEETAGHGRVEDGESEVGLQLVGRARVEDGGGALTG